MDDLFLTEFRPPDDSMIEFILNTSIALGIISKRETLSVEDSAVLERASHSIKVMLAMAVGGHFLFTSEAKHADALADLCGRLYDHLVMSGIPDAPEFDIDALKAFQSYREEGPDVDDLPFPGMSP